MAQSMSFSSSTDLAKTKSSTIFGTQLRSSKIEQTQLRIFDSFNEEHLRAALGKMGVSSHALEDVLDKVKNRHYQLACTLTFEAVHGASCDAGINHPNQYFSDSRKILESQSKHLVVFTGAGISTSCGIPDFRGPKGIWTLQRQGKALPEASLPFHRATPSITHMALVELEKAGIMKFLISQNVDGLHLRSGISRDKLSELHGNSFLELCPSCGAEYLRDFEVETIGLKESTRRCTKTGCSSKLRDTVLDWEDALPPKEMNPAEKHCKMADVVLCLGTSLQITPACNLPLKCLKGGGKITIVNLQKTPKDKNASLVIHGRADKVIAGVMNMLNMRIPSFVRIDLFQIILTQALSLDKKYVNWTLRIASVHGKQAPLPFVKTVEIAFPEILNMKEAVLDKNPLYLKRRTARTTKPFDISLKLNFGAGCKCSSTQIKIPVDFEISTDCLKEDKDSIIQNLKDKAIENPRCGQTAVIERRAVLIPKSDVTVHAIVTNVIEYSSGDLETPSLNNCSLKRRIELDSGITWKQTKARKHNSRNRSNKVAIKLL